MSLRSDRVPVEVSSSPKLRLRRRVLSGLAAPLFIAALGVFLGCQSVPGLLPDDPFKQHQGDDPVGAARIRRDLALAQWVLDQARQSGNKPLQAQELHIITLLYVELGEPETALRHGEQALEMWKELMDMRALAKTLVALGQAHRLAHDPQQATSTLHTALQVSRSVQAEAVAADALDAMGQLYADGRDTQSALTYYGQALEAHKRTGDLAGQATVLLHMCRAHVEAREAGSARDACQRALEIAQHQGDEPLAGLAYHLTGDVHAAQKDWTSALKAYRQALVWTIRADDRPVQYLTLKKLAATYLEGLGDEKKAKSYAAAAQQVRDGYDVSHLLNAETAP